MAMQWLEADFEVFGAVSQCGRIRIRTRKSPGKTVFAWLPLAMAVVVGSATYANAGEVIQANANSSWFWSTKPGGASSIGQGNYTVGENKATAGVNTLTAGPITSSYAASVGLGPVGINPSVSDDGAKANALSTFDVKAAVNNWYPWTMKLTAYAEGGFFSPNASSHAQANDPQYFQGSSSSSLTMTNTITLQAGSSVYESGPGGTATSFFDQSTDLLAKPILSIGIIGSTTGNVTADVWFNPNPNLTFSMSSAALTSLIEGSAIGKAGGISSDIAFTYTWNLPSAGVTSSDWIGANGANNASVVPEPSSMILIVTGLFGVLGYKRLSRTCDSR
jgi:hypothetical protein